MKKRILLSAILIFTSVAALSPAQASAGQPDPIPLVQETFAGPALTTSPWVLPSVPSGANTACLSNPAASMSATPLPGCASTGNGSLDGLQLTSAADSEQGGVTYGLSVPTSEGLDATFDAYQWGGGGADGIAFFLAASDPSNPSAPTIGPPGGSMGYEANNLSGQTNGNGVSDGYLGFGLDAYGNFSSITDTASGCANPGGATGTPNAVDVRGPGNGLTGYCMLSSTGDLSGSLESGGSPVAVPVEVAVNPSNAAITTVNGLQVPASSWAVAVQPTGFTNPSTSSCPANAQCLTGALPSTANGEIPAGTIPSGYLDSTGIPEQLTFGWSGSTGGVTDYHLINDVNVTTLTSAPPAYSVGLSDNTGGNAVTTGAQVEFTAAVTLSGAQENDPVTITDNLPAGLEPDTGLDAGTPLSLGGGFSCPSTTTSTESCTYTPPPGGLPAGSVLQVQFGASVESTGATAALSDEVTVSSQDGLPASGSDTVHYSPPVITTSLSTSSPTVAGVETVDGSIVPGTATTSSATDNTDESSAPLRSIPLRSIGLGSSPLRSIPLRSIPLRSIGLPEETGAGNSAAFAALSTTLLSNLTVDYTDPTCPTGMAASLCAGWPGILQGSSIPPESPLETLTLAQVLDDPVADAHLNSVDLGNLDLSSSSLDSLPLSALLLGNVPLSSIDLDGTPAAPTAAAAAALSSWCSELATLQSAGADPFSCNDFGITAGTTANTDVSLLSLALAGVPLQSVPLRSIPLRSIALTSSQLSSLSTSSDDPVSIPLRSISLGSIDLASSPLRSIPLRSIDLSPAAAGTSPLRSIPLRSIPLRSIATGAIDCTAVDCSTAALGDAYDANAISATATLGDINNFGTYSGGGDTDGPTVGDLVDTVNQSDATYDSLTLEDLLATTVPPATYQWPSANLAALPLAANELNGGTVDYSVDIVVAATPATNFIATVTLPATFAYVPGTATLDGTAEPDPSVSGQTLTWTFPTLSAASHVLSFEANAGIDLGPVTTTLNASVGTTTLSPANATVDVVDGEEPSITSSATPATVTPGVVNTATTTDGALNIGYITSPDDLNYWSVNVPQNAELSLALTNIPSGASDDLVLYGPGAAQLNTSPSQAIAGVTDTVPNLASSTTTEGTPGSQDIPVTPPAGDQLLALSNNPQNQSQYIQTPPLAAGIYTVQISGYNGSFSAQPYLLQADLLGGSSPASCPGGITYPGTVPAAAAPLSGNVASSTNTLFLVNTQRLTAAFPNTPGAVDDEATIMKNLAALSGDTSAGVNGVVVPVDSYATVQSAYALWNQDPCSVTAANQVVSSIASVINSIEAEPTHPDIQNVVIVGADDQIPFARIADGAAQSNERDYGQSTFQGENNVEAAALSQGYYFSNDPYVANNPLGVGSATLYVPQAATGRLVETAAEIDSALSRFVNSNGDLNATSSLTTGYSFLTGGAQAVSANLAGDGLQSVGDLINETWQESDLAGALKKAEGGLADSPPQTSVDSINAHFDFYAALPALDNTNGDENNLFTTTDARELPEASQSSYVGGLLFSMGCHAGLDVDSTEVAASGVGPVDDWATTFADSGALWVANTGYGYADDTTLAYSAKLMSLFAGNLKDLTVGQALAEAKQQYAASNAILSPYDLKAMMESTFYGLPMYNLNSSTATGQSTPTSNLTPAAVNGTGFDAAGLSADNTTFTNATTNPDGGYYTAAPSSTGIGAGVQTTEYRPIEPLLSAPVTVSGYVAHGYVINHLSSSDHQGFTPTFSQPAVGSEDSSSPDIGDAAFPGTIPRVAGYSAFTSSGTKPGSTLNLIAGQFFADPSHPGQGTQRLFGFIDGDVTYQPANSALANDFAPPTIDSSQGLISGGAVNFQVDATPSSATDPVQQVFVLYTDQAQPGQWTQVSLSSSDGLAWSGQGSAPSGGDNVQYIVEAVDEAGNVAFSNDEGADFDNTPQPAVAITLSGAQSGGSYSSAVTATITAPSGSSYVLDGSAPTPVPANGQFTVTAPGHHILTVTGSDSANDTVSQSFSISATPTRTVVTSDAPDPVVGQPFAYTAAVTGPAGTTTAPNGSIEFFDNTVPIAGCTNLPLNGGVATCPDLSAVPTTGDDITATYTPGSGSSFAASATTAALVQPVALASTSVTVGLSPSSPSSPTVGQQVTYSATVSPVAPGSGTPSGAVTFYDGTSPLGCGSNGTVTLSSPSSTATCPVMFSAAGAHSITAVYSGDRSFSSSTAAAPLSQTIGTAASSGTLNSSLNPSDLGDSVTFSATIAPATPFSGAVVPSGTVTFYDGTAALGCGPDGTVTLSGGSAVCKVPFLSAGPHSISSQYSGDNNYSGLSGTSSPQVTQSVNKVNPTVKVTTTGPSSVGVGQGITFSATVTGIASVTPSGDVQFIDNGVAVSCSGLTTEALVNGAVNCATTLARTGTNAISVNYLGDGNYSATSSGQINETGNLIGTNASLSGPLPTASVVVGQTVTYTAGISSAVAGTATPAGAVTFQVDAAPASCNGAPTVTLVNGSATCQVAFTSPGSHQVTVSYPGDNVTFAASSASVSQGVSQATSTVGLAVAAPSTSSSVVGQPVTYTVTAKAPYPNGPVPTGAVTFTSGATPLTCVGQTKVTLSGGSATCSIVFTSVGTPQIKAVYAGDTNYVGGSAALSQTVKAASTAIALSVPSPVAVGQAVTYAATLSVVAPGSGTPNGVLDFYDGQTLVACNGAKAAAGVALSSADTASCQTTFPAAMPQQITVAYPGSTNFALSSVTVNQTVNQATPTVTVAVGAPSQATSVVGQPVTLVATVAPQYPGATAPTGSVTFVDGTTPISCRPRTVVALAAGKATCTVVFSAAGAHSVTVAYLGDQNYSAHSSLPIVQTVKAAPTATVVIPAPLVATVGQPVIYLAVVLPTGSGSGLVTGTVKFLDGSSLMACNGAAVAAPVATNGLGIATCTVKYAATGTHIISAGFSGTANYSASTSPSFPEVVTTSTATGLTPSANPGTVGKAVTYTAKVTAGPGGSAPTGNVVFRDNGTPVAACGRSTGAALNSSGAATCAETYSSSGSHSIVAVYQGNPYLNGSSAPALAEVIHS